MNEYRWYPNEQRPLENSGVKNKTKKNKNSHPVLYSVIASSMICILGISIIGGIVISRTSGNNRFSSNIQIDDGREKTDIGSVITPTDGELMSVSAINESVGPSVVGILSRSTLNGFLNKETDIGSGSGVIISKDGYIITNNHVVENASNLTVVLHDGTEYPASLVGTDSRTDLAVVKINADNLSAAVLGDSNAVKVGELAVAIGNPLGQKLAGSVTAGVISAVNRNLAVEGKTLNLLQTDAAINPGNSGGALVNCYGEVIGINTVKVSSTSIEGIGFAIPISDAKPIIDELISNGRVSGRPQLGITGSDAPYGVVVQSVSEGSAAEKAGIAVGDLIIKFDGTAITSVAEINDLKNKFRAGDSVVLTIYRDGELSEITVVLDEEK